MIVDPMPRAARDELERLGVRWQHLPLARALPHVPALTSLAQRLADAAADSAGLPRHELPDLGPATAYDQLVVAAYDVAVAARAGVAADAATTSSAAVSVDLAAELATLRGVLADA